ncbi:hypothetical protein [Undibacterium sp. Ji49W]|uniref:hypothetical protein n=1 Tax=Undibacterium sp. Ji49W TaxID=3413040 RepID=UPI003BF01959
MGYTIRQFTDCLHLQRVLQCLLDFFQCDYSFIFLGNVPGNLGIADKLTESSINRINHDVGAKLVAIPPDTPAFGLVTP